VIALPDEAIENPATPALRLRRVLDVTWRLGGSTSLLRHAAAGNEQAFMAFYDATHRDAYRLELVRASAEGFMDNAGRRVAETRTRKRYVAAWRSAGYQQLSRLSPLAWLLALPVTPEPDLAAEQGPSCA
jgi:hypothetical protein